MDREKAQTQLTPELWLEAVKLLEQGYRIYVPVREGDKPQYTWFYYATLPEDPRGFQVAYVQDDRLCGIQYSTSHQQCREAGTGYHLGNRPRDPAAAFVHIPEGFSRSDHKYVRKHTEASFARGTRWMRYEWLTP